MQKLLTKNEKKYVSDLIYYTIDEIKNFKNGNVIVDGVYVRLWDGTPLQGDDMD